MKKTMIRIGKSVAIQIAAFSIICGMVALAVSFPTSTPVGQVSGGKFQQYFDSIFGAITFNSGKASTTTPTMSGHIATKGYVDNLPIDATKITGTINKARLDKAPMPNSGDNSDKIATTAWVKANTASAAGTNNYFCVNVTSFNVYKDTLRAYGTPTSINDYTTSSSIFKSYPKIEYIYTDINYNNIRFYSNISDGNTQVSVNYPLDFCYGPR